MKNLTQTIATVLTLILGVAGMSARAQDGTAEPNALGPVPPPDTYKVRWDTVQVRQELAKTPGVWWDANGVSMGVRLVTRQSIVVSGSLQFQSTSHVLGVNLGSLLVRRVLDDQGQPIKLKPRTSYPLVLARGVIDYTQLVHARSMYWGWPATVISGESDSLGLWGPESVTDGNESEGDAPAPSEEPTAPPGMTGSLAFSIQFDLAADQNVPASLSLLECQALVLCARSYLAADVPFVASDLWHEPVPDLQIRVSKASAGYSEYAFGTESRCDGGLVRCFPQSYPFEPARESVLSISPMPNNSLWPGLSYSSFGSQQAGTPMPTYILVNTELLQADGAPYLIWGVQEMRNNYLQTSANSEGIVWAVLAPYAPASIRHVFAVAPYDTPIPITLRDVPVVQEETGFSSRKSPAACASPPPTDLRTFASLAFCPPAVNRPGRHCHNRKDSHPPPRCLSKVSGIRRFGSSPLSGWQRQAPTRSPAAQRPSGPRADLLGDGLLFHTQEPSPKPPCPDAQRRCGEAATRRNTFTHLHHVSVGCPAAVEGFPGGFGMSL